MHDLISARAAAAPHAVAVVFGGVSMTYAELEGRAEAIADRLRGAGVGPGVLVALLVDRSLDMPVGLLGILKAGGAYLPLDPFYPSERIAFVLRDAGVRVLVTQRSLRDRFADLAPVTVLVDELEAETGGGRRGRETLESEQPKSPDPSLPSRPQSPPAYVIYTSGSTGTPKGVAVSHRSLSNFLRSMQRVPGISADDVVAAVTTVSFDIAGLELWLPLTVGAKVVVVPSDVTRDGVRLQALLDRARVTVLQGTPTAFRLLLESGWSGRRRLKILCGGETLSRDLADRLLPRCASLWNMYGPTETTVWSTVQRVTPGRDAVPIGRPIDNTTVHILDADGVPVTPGEAGELYIGGEGVALGYINRPELTRERFVPDPFSAVPGARLYRTGDRVRALPDGSLSFLGRLDQQVKIRGFRIEPGEVESALMLDPAVGHAVAAAVGEDGKDLRLVAFVVSRPGHTVDPAALRASLRRTLPEYMVPSRVLVLASLPLTPNGKVDRKALPPPPSDLEEPADSPRDEVERKLAAVWEDLLAVRPVGPTSDWFQLGGDSLMAVQLFARIAREFGRDLPITTLVEATTVEQLACRIRENGGPPRGALVPIRASGSRRPLFFVHGGGGTVLFLRDLAAVLASDRPLYGLQSEGLDGCRMVHVRVEQMAARYLQAIREVQAQGPYLLAGYCFGGLVAFEMARQLRRSGETVALLALINAPNPAVATERVAAPREPESSSRSSPSVLDSAGTHRRALAALPAAERLAYLRRAVRDGLAWRWDALNASEGWLKVRGRILHLLLVGLPTLPPSWRPVYVAAMTAWAEKGYKPRPYDGHLLLIRGANLYRDPELGWRGLARTIDTREVGGPQRLRRDLISSRLISELAVELDRALDANAAEL